MIRIGLNGRRRLMGRLNLVIADLTVLKVRARLLVLRMNGTRLNRNVSPMGWNGCRRMLIVVVGRRLMLRSRRRMSTSLYRLLWTRYGVRLMRMGLR